MSHQSGISISSELTSSFQQAQTNTNVRALKVVIEDDQLVPDGTIDRRGDDVADFGLLRVEPTIPTYILYRLDQGTAWLVSNLLAVAHTQV